jgi:hypothetical protein
MRRVTFLLRMWVIVGAVLLLLQTPKGGQGYAEYSPGSCINFATAPQTCPSGCTISSFTQYTQASGNGVYYLAVYSTTPCGSAKQGETCNNPTQYFQVYDFKDCCAALEAGCTGVGHSYLNCCDPSPVVCAEPKMFCCYEDGSPCTPGQEPNYCCSELCLHYNKECGTCSLLTEPCGDLSDCCSSVGEECQSNKCCLSIGQTCSGVGIGDVDCCSGHCADRYGKCICVS